jgi:hypothetical protein
MQTLSDIARDRGVSRTAVAKWLTKAEQQFGPIPHTQDGNRKLYGPDAVANILAVAPMVANQIETSCEPVANQFQNQFAIVTQTSVPQTDTAALAMGASSGLQDALANAATLTGILGNKVALIKQHALEVHGERHAELGQAAQILEQLRDTQANINSLARINRDRDIHHSNQVQAIVQEIGQLTEGLSQAPAPAPAATPVPAKKS